MRHTHKEQRGANDIKKNRRNQGERVNKEDLKNDMKRTDAER